MNFIPEIAWDTKSIIFIIFCSAVLIQLLFLMRFSWRLLLHKRRDELKDLPPVSVVVCARNEEDNLFKNLPKVLHQDYPEFEVIVVNDQSVDDSRHIIRAFQERYPFLRHVELERNKHRKFGKKVPLTVGIKGTKHEHLLMIDADCYPDSNQWIRKMMRNYVPGKEIVLGYGPYEKKKGFLNKLIRFDTANIAATYLSFAKSKRPYMGVGRNLSYLKSTFFKVDGFKKHYHIQSGDDDLFMQDAATRKNVAIEIDPETFVYSHPKESFKEWVKQKQRHFTTAAKYRLINKVFLGIFPASMILMLLSFIILMISFEWKLFVLGIFLVRYIMFWWVNGLVLKQFKERDLIVIYPFLELLHFVIIPFIYYSTDRRQSSRW